MSDKYNITYEYVCQCFREENGLLYWKIRPVEHFVDQRICKSWNTRFSGKEAGNVNTKAKGGPRCYIDINGKTYLRYIIIWMLYYGYWSDGLDHKDRNSLNDSIGNLREATQSQNNANTSINIRNTSGLKGVSFCSITGKWRANIKAGCHQIALGRFDTRELAHEAYMKAARFHFGEFATDGK